MTGDLTPAPDAAIASISTRSSYSNPRALRVPSSPSLVFAVCGTLLVGVFGCWTPGSGIPGEPSYDDPLEVWFSGGPNEASAFVSFYLTRPAYVAIFEVARQGQVRAVYPYAVRSAQRPVGPGLYAIARFTGSSRILVSCSAPLMYRLIIASEHPLRLDRLRGRVSFALRPALSNFFLASAGFGGTLDRLVEDLVPRYPAGPRPQWATHWETQLFDRGLCSRSSQVDALLGARAIALGQAGGELPVGEPTEKKASPTEPTLPEIPSSPPVLEPTEGDEHRARREGVSHAPSGFRTPEPYWIADAYRSPVRLPDIRSVPRDAVRLNGRDDRGFPAIGGRRSLPSRDFGSIRDWSSRSGARGSSRGGSRSPRALPSTRTRPTAGRRVRPTRTTGVTRGAAPRATGSSRSGTRGGGDGRASGRRKPDGS